MKELYKPSQRVGETPEMVVLMLRIDGLHRSVTIQPCKLIFESTKLGDSIRFVLRTQMRARLGLSLVHRDRRGSGRFGQRVMTAVLLISARSFTST